MLKIICDDCGKELFRTELYTVQTFGDFVVKMTNDDNCYELPHPDFEMGED